MLDGLRAARKTVNTRNTDGVFAKAERANHVVVPAGSFRRVDDITTLARVLFVPPA